MLRLSRHARWIEFPAPVRDQGKTENRSFWAPSSALRIIKNECGFSAPHLPHALFSSLDVRLTPESGQMADMSACLLSANNDRMQRSKKAVLFDRFVGPHKQCWRDTRDRVPSRLCASVNSKTPPRSPHGGVSALGTRRKPPSEPRHSDEQARNHKHHSGDEHGQARKQQKVAQEYMHTPASPYLPCAGPS